MKYNFDEIIERRNTNALNTDGFRGYIFHAGPEKVFPFKDEEFIRMWVADMEFATPPEIRDAMKARIDKKIFGYSGVYDSEYYDIFSKWCKDMYDWEFPQEQKQHPWQLYRQSELSSIFLRSFDFPPHFP